MRVLVVVEPGRGGAAALDRARELAEVADAVLTLVAIAPWAASGSRCGNSAIDYNAVVAETVADDLIAARARLGEAGAGVPAELLDGGRGSDLARFVADGAFDMVLLPGRRGLRREARHPAAERLRRAGTADVVVVGPAAGPAHVARQGR
ncbi:MAG TPA: universal stress protein [Solirubrobacteraceae bacterium]|jgi:hypothetical protein|nr:universal stress protein [Solirubrobacteraceae bacterium]